MIFVNSSLNFERSKIEEDKSFFILRNLLPVGLFAYKEISATENTY